MSEDLKDQRRAAANETGDSLVIFLHGYGADGADLLGLADPLAPHMPGTVFRAPDAPERSVANPMGYQWFPIPWIDGSSEEAATASMRRSLDLLTGYLDRVAAEEGIAPERTVLFGFSQGTMMSLHHALRRDDALAGVVGFSGRLLAPETLADEITARPPVLLVHGDADEVVPFASLQDAGQALDAAGVETYAHVMNGTGHGIAADGLSVALSFMRDRLVIET